MSQCKVCMDFYHPDFITYTERLGDVIKICAFCRTDKQEITVTDDNGKIVKVVQKKQASNDYKKWLDELRKKPNMAKIIDEQQI